MSTALGVALLFGGVASGVAKDAKAAPETAEVKPEAALKSEAKPLSEEEKKFRTLLQSVGALFSERQFELAMEKLQEAEKLRPQSDDVQGAKAGIFAETGRFDEARAIYDKLVAENPKSFVPRFNQAELFSMQKQYDQARSGFEALLKDFPENDFLYFKMMLTYLVEKNNQMAAEWGRKLQRPTPTPVMYYTAAAMSITGGEILKGKNLILAAENDFGPGRHALLYQSLAAMGLVLQGDYPPQVPAPPQAAAANTPKATTPSAAQ